MRVPEFWSESTVKKVVDGHSFTIKRFGWSDTSAADAKAHAVMRLEEALRELAEKGDVRRIDHKVPYNGAEGLPIREEIISKHDDVVITRNAYGARCLNTPDVLFADIDFTDDPAGWLIGLSFALLIGASALMSMLTDAWIVMLPGFFIAIIFMSSLAMGMHVIARSLQGGVDKMALQTIHRVVQRNPELHLRVYKTPNGYRILAMHDIFKPDSDASIDLLKQLDSDPMFIQMCRRQQCFRARVSPKPWRIGLDRLASKAVWPLDAARLEKRQAWVRHYEKASEDYASCRFVMQLGSQTVHPKAEFVRRLHDQFCKSDREMQIA